MTNLFFRGIMSDGATDSVPLAARGFLLALVVCLHVVGATVLLRVPELPQHNEEPVILRASWIEIKPPVLPQLPVVQPARAPGHRQAQPRIPTLSPFQQTQSEPALITVDIPPATPMESPDSDPRLNVVTTTKEGAEDDVDPDFNVSHFSNPKPEYPFLSRRLREQGWVKLRVHVTVDGLADEVTLHTSSGFERLDKAAADAVKRWQFRPAWRAGKPVAGWVVVPVRFELQ
ncbi:MAG: TonB family protein [Proteobacteria bacterium]|nr:TonB family protein [Pseudomonadota bacterium]